MQTANRYYRANEPRSPIPSDFSPFPDVGIRIALLPAPNRRGSFSPYHLPSNPGTSTNAAVPISLALSRMILFRNAAFNRLATLVDARPTMRRECLRESVRDREPPAVTLTSTLISTFRAEVALSLPLNAIAGVNFRSSREMLRRNHRYTREATQPKRRFTFTRGAGENFCTSHSRLFSREADYIALSISDSRY